MNLVSEAQPPSLKPPIAAVLLSIVLAVFLADAAVSLMDDLLHLGGLRILGGIRAIRHKRLGCTGLANRPAAPPGHSGESGQARPEQDQARRLRHR